MPSTRESATDAFKRELEELVLSAFSRGAAVEGEWEIDVPVSMAPNWRILIEKQDPDSESSYDPTLLDEEE